MRSNICGRPQPYPPSSPRLRRNFRWKGRYIVPDLNINVPFTWHANNGNVQMIAGSENHRIHFTNLIYNNHLYTYTYKWPGLQPEFLPPLENCAPLFRFSIRDLNTFFATSQYVGPEILLGKTNQHVHHFRASVVVPELPSGFYPRLPVSSADIYVDRADSSRFVQVLHFGLQNIYDPSLDEWIIVNKFSNRPGRVILPPVCT